MTQLLHLVRKDARRLRWPIATWMGILGVRVFLATVGPTLAIEGLGAQLAFREMEGAVAALEKLMLALLVARLVHEEPLVGLHAFWLTRPYDRGTLLAAKLLFAAVSFVVFPWTADLITMALFDAGPHDLLRATPAFLAGHVRWTLGFMVIAVLTPSIAVFALAIAGTVAAFALASVVFLSVAVMTVDESSSYASSLVGDMTPALVALGILVFASLTVIVYQYRNRRRPRALVLLTLGVAALVVVPSLWPWPFARELEPDPGAWALDSTRAAASIDTSQPLHVSDVLSLRESESPRRQLSGRVRLTGMPDQFGLQSVAARSRFELPGGVTLRSAQMDGVGRPPTTGPADAVTVASPIQAVLGDVRLLSSVPPVGEIWPALLTMTEEEYARVREQPGRLALTLDFHLQRSRLVGALPLAEGSRLDEDSTRIEIVRVRRRTNGVVLLLRYWRVESLLTPSRNNTYQFVLRNRAQREALAAPGQLSYGSHAGISVGSITFGLGQLGPRGFMVDNWVLEFPGRELQVASPIRISPEWLDAADLVVVETAYAGRVTRALTLDEVRIP